MKCAARKAGRRPGRIRPGRIYCEDNLVTTDRFADGSLDLTVTSPPYDDLRTYNGFTYDASALAVGLYRATKPGGIVVWVVRDQVKNHRLSLTSFRQVLAFDAAGWGLFQIIIYEQATMAAPRNRRYQDSFEFMFVFSKGRPATVNLIKDRPNVSAGRTKQRPKIRMRDGRHRVSPPVDYADFGKRWTIWKYWNSFNSGTRDAVAYRHPATFPEALAADHIKSWSNPGEIVYDPFLGAGTTAKMAALLGRTFVGSELSPEYCTGIIAPRLLEHGIKHTLSLPHPHNQELPFHHAM